MLNFNRAAYSKPSTFHLVSLTFGTVLVDEGCWKVHCGCVHASPVHAAPVQLAPAPGKFGCTLLQRRDLFPSLQIQRPPKPRAGLGSGVGGKRAGGGHLAQRSIKQAVSSPQRFIGVERRILNVSSNQGFVLARHLPLGWQASY